MIETATGVTEGPVGQVAPAASSAPAGHAGPAEPDIAPVPDISGHFVVGAVEAVGSAHPGVPATSATPGVAYGGRFFVDEDTSTLHHDVTVSMMPELLAQPQFRHASVDGDLLTLSATRTDDTGVTTHSTLVWRRAKGIKNP